MPRKTVPIDPDLRLRDCPERAVGMDWPTPISERLDALIALVEDDGERTNRKELAAALLLAAPESSDELARCLKEYRRARARDALLGGQAEGDVLVFQRHKPGPRPKRQAG